MADSRSVGLRGSASVAPTCNDRCHGDGDDTLAIRVPGPLGVPVRIRARAALAILAVHSRRSKAKAAGRPLLPLETPTQ